MYVWAATWIGLLQPNRLTHFGQLIPGLEPVIIRTSPGAPFRRVGSANFSERYSKRLIQTIDVVDCWFLDDSYSASNPLYKCHRDPSYRSHLLLSRLDTAQEDYAHRIQGILQLGLTSSVLRH